MHLPGYGDPGRSEIVEINEYLKGKYATVLNRLATGAQPANADEQRIADMFKGDRPSAYAAAAQNLRVQQGLRERFRQGLLRSKYYRPTMERIFRSAGLPPELVTLASVESGFHSGARSSAGAVGIWQFTRGTGTQYMRLTRYHDDRLDPTKETHAAAALLRSNYEALGSWPLAITAYNYGTGGTSRAAAEYGGDYNRIVRNYNGPRFGFASKNYYAEFLAALEVHRHEDKYFPDLKYSEVPEPPPVKTDFAPPHRKHNSSRHHSRHTAKSNRHHSSRHGHTVTQARNHNHRHASSKAVASAHSSHHGSSHRVIARGSKKTNHRDRAVREARNHRHRHTSSKAVAAAPSSQKKRGQDAVASEGGKTGSDS
jgi:Transglycosylase SLT domain